MAVQGVLAKHLHTTATQFSKATVATSRAAAFYGPKRDAKATPNVRALNATAVAAPVLAEAPAAAPVPLPPPRKPVKKSINDAKVRGGPGGRPWPATRPARPLPVAPCTCGRPR